MVKLELLCKLFHHFGPPSKHFGFCAGFCPIYSNPSLDMDGHCYLKFRHGRSLLPKV